MEQEKEKAPIWIYEGGTGAITVIWFLICATWITLIMIYGANK